MAVTSTPVFPQTPKITPVQILPADTTAQKTAYTAGANGSKVVAVMATSNDTAAHDVQISLTRGGTSYLIGTINVPIGAGNTGSVPSVDIIPNSVQLPGLPVDSDGNTYLLLVSGDTLTVAVVVAVSTNKTVNVVAVGSDF